MSEQLCGAQLPGGVKNTAASAAQLCITDEQVLRNQHPFIDFKMIITSSMNTSSLGICLFLNYVAGSFLTMKCF